MNTKPIEIQKDLTIILKYQDSDETSDQTYLGQADADFAAWQGKYFGTSTMKENVIARMIAER